MLIFLVTLRCANLLAKIYDLIPFIFNLQKPNFITQMVLQIVLGNFSQIQGPCIAVIVKLLKMIESHVASEDVYPCKKIKTKSSFSLDSMSIQYWDPIMLI